MIISHPLLLLACYFACYNALQHAFRQGKRSFITKTLASSHTALSSEIVSHYEELTVPTLKDIYFADLTPSIRAILQKVGVKSGQVCILSKHTTTSITINEMEARLVDDARQYLLKLAPPSYPYLHNDLHLRSGPPGWPGGDEAWRAQEPINAHSHLLNMLIGSSETVPIHDGKLMIGNWQSIIMVSSCILCSIQSNMTIPSTCRSS